MSIDIDSLVFDLEVVAQDGKLLHLPWGQLTWGFAAKEMAVRLTFTVPDMDTERGWAGQLVVEGTPVILNAGPVGQMTEQFRGLVKAHTRGLDAQSPIQITAYDILFDLIGSKDDFYYPDGTTGRQVLQDLATRGNLPVGQIDGPDVPLGTLLYRGKTFGDVITDVFARTRYLDGSLWQMYAKGGLIYVQKPGNNGTVLWLKSGQSIFGGQESVSIENMITRVKVYMNPPTTPPGRDPSGKLTSGTPSAGAQPAVLIDTVDGQTAMGIKQDVVYARRGQEDAVAVQAAQAILGAKGYPIRQMQLTAPLVPSLVPGDRLHVTAGTTDGYVFVSDASFDGTARQMMLTLTADLAMGWSDQNAIDLSTPDETQDPSVSTSVGPEFSGGPNAPVTGGFSGFNPSTPPILQQANWTCSAVSLAWLLTSIGRPTTEDQGVADLAGHISSVGVSPYDGSPQAEYLRSLGLNAHNSAVTFDDVLAMAGVVPVVMGGRGFNHWVGVAGASGGQLILANPSPGYDGVGQTMSRAQFENGGLGPFYAAWVSP